jgi:hypothetical protein
MTTDSAIYLSNLHKLLDHYFNLEEIRTLCFDLGVDFDNVGGEGKSARIRELLIGLGRQERLSDLLGVVRQQRPRVAWPPVPAGFQMPASLVPGSSAGTVVQNHYYGDQVGGDKISVGNVSGTGIAIGRGSSTNVQIQQGLDAEQLNLLFAPLLTEVERHDPAAAVKVEALKAEAARGEEADDEKMAGLIEDIVDAVPSVVEEVINMFTNQIVAKAAGGATKYILKRIQR